MPLIAVIPFVALLAAIAILPLTASHFWDQHRNKGLVAAALSLPVLWMLRAQPHALLHTAFDYLSFVGLLGSLFVVTGGIHLSGDLKATPKTNLFLLGLGGVLASVIGTTGASMLLLRTVLRTNSERKNTSHLPFFFILIVSNAGGLLTPLGDPPLFLGFLRGVPFFWTLRLWPIWLGALGYLLTLFYWVDRRAYAKEDAGSLALDTARVEPLAMSGKRNLLALLAIIGAVFLPAPYRELVMVAAAGWSLLAGPKAPRRLNAFTFGPIIEVAVLFAGIFITMLPALALLETHGGALGLRAPWQYFLASGSLSSVLDNAPTYLTFLSAAQGLHLAPEIVGIPTSFLVAISAGSVLMGANTYIGNGPNFMVKAVADEAGYKTYSFGRYAVLAIATLCPLYLLLTLWLMR